MHVPRTDQLAKAFEVLVLDDEPEIRELLAEHLRARGYRVATASDRLAAVSLINRRVGQFSPTSICRVQMAGGSAGGARREPVDAGRNYHRYASLDSAITAVRLGAYDYLTKPLSLGQIDVLMARVTGSRSRKIARPCVG
jgi:two-component system, NtrC family, response regulator AtoC